jgi:hypothetical protein
MAEWKVITRSGYECSIDLCLTRRIQCHLEYPDLLVEKIADTKSAIESDLETARSLLKSRYDDNPIEVTATAHEHCLDISGYLTIYYISAEQLEESVAILVYAGWEDRDKGKYDQRLYGRA